MPVSYAKIYSKNNQIPRLKSSVGKNNPFPLKFNVGKVFWNFTQNTTHILLDSKSLYKLDETN